MKKTSRTLMLFASSSLALHAANAYADAHSKATTSSTGAVNSNLILDEDQLLRLDQVAYPESLLSTPDNSNYGTLYRSAVQQELAQAATPHIDFVISGIHAGQQPVMVYLAYSTSLGDSSQWSDLGIQQLELDRANMQLLGAYRVESTQTQLTNQVTPLGSSQLSGNSAVISVALSDLNDLSFISEHVYFQAIAVPLIDNTPDFSQAVASELDQYRLSRPSVMAKTEGALDLKLNTEAKAQLGWAFGSNKNKASVLYSYTGNGKARYLHVMGYDVDTNDEICVYLNDEQIACLKRGRNNKFAPSEVITLPAAKQKAGENLVEFRQKKPGYKWGITRVGLFDNNDNGEGGSTSSGDATALKLNEKDTHQWGWVYGDNAHKDKVVFSFTGNGKIRYLHVAGYDVDTHDEICIYLNDRQIACLKKGPNNRLARAQLITLRAVHQQAGENIVEFRQKRPGFKWGITQVGLYDTTNVGSGSSSSSSSSGSNSSGSNSSGGKGSSSGTSSSSSGSSSGSTSGSSGGKGGSSSSSGATSSSSSGNSSSGTSTSSGSNSSGSSGGKSSSGSSSGGK